VQLPPGQGLVRRGTSAGGGQQQRRYHDEHGEGEQEGSAAEGHRTLAIGVRLARLEGSRPAVRPTIEGT
jgi:hypothetical protein